MDLLAYGHAGMPMLVFPSSQKRFYEYEQNGMIHAIWQRIESGNLQVFCVDGIDSESWYNREVHPHDRVRRQIAYESYLVHEVYPFIRQSNSNTQFCTTGCSLGGYHAFNFAMKHPDLVSNCTAMSGCFDMSPFIDGQYNTDFYFNNPVDYIANLDDRWFLDRYRQMRLVLAVGDWDICLGENCRMAHVLRMRGIPHWLDVWGGGEQHDWPLWRRMSQKFFNS